MVESELDDETGTFSESKVKEIQSLCNSIQEFCVLERPPKSWKGSKTEKDDRLTTVKQEIRIPFPKYHYDKMEIPPKRITVTIIFTLITINITLF